MPNASLKHSPGRALKVAVLADTLPPAGFSGVGNSHLGLYQALRAAGVDARIIGETGGPPDTVEILL